MSSTGKLRMKASKFDEPDSSKRKRRRRRRRRHEPTAFESEPIIDAPPPPQSHNPTASTSSNVRDDNDDEYVINWTTTSPRIASKLLSTCYDSQFRDRLLNALDDDEPFDAFEKQYMFNVPNRWRQSETVARSGTDVMEEEEYAEYVRKNMWRRSHRREILDLEAKEKEAAVESQRLEERRRKRRLERLDKEKQRRRRAEKLERKEKQLLRESYHAKWIQLQNTALSPPSLRYSDIPWPWYSTIGDTPITSETILDFLVGHLPADDAVGRKKVLRSAVLAYHPDRFTHHLDKVKEVGGGKERVQQQALRVSQLLNEVK